MRAALGLAAIASVCMLGVGCAHTPTKPGERADLQRAAVQTVQQMEAQDPSLRPLIDQSVGYVVFPAVGSGGFLVGGGAGSGVVFQNGQPVGFAELSHLNVGALAGGQRYSELVIVKTPEAFESLRNGRFNFSANASAVLVRSGAATRATWDNGVAVFVHPVRGAMVNASIGGQRIRFTM